MPIPLVAHSILTLVLIVNLNLSIMLGDFRVAATGIEITEDGYDDFGRRTVSTITVTMYCNAPGTPLT